MKNTAIIILNKKRGDDLDDNNTNFYENINRENLQATFAERFYNLRKTCGLTNMQVAEIIDISDSFMGLISRGARFPSLITMVKLKYALNTSLDYLVLGEDNVGISENYSEYFFSKLTQKEIDFIVSFCMKINSRGCKDFEFDFLLEMADSFSKLKREE